MFERERVRGRKERGEGPLEGGGVRLNRLGGARRVRLER